jgi:hypothetical protein
MIVMLHLNLQMMLTTKLKQKFYMKKNIDKIEVLVHLISFEILHYEKSIA